MACKHGKDLEVLAAGITEILEKLKSYQESLLEYAETWEIEAEAPEVYLEDARDEVAELRIELLDAQTTLKHLESKLDAADSEQYKAATNNLEGRQDAE